MRASERETIAQFITEMEFDHGMSVKHCVENLSKTDKKFKEIYDIWCEFMQKETDSEKDYEEELNKALEEEFGRKANDAPVFKKDSQNGKKYTEIHNELFKKHFPSKYREGI